mmetsp:Transcript_10970/g.28784  ORF Transcript_10970/g.28784 Transcript_10970/m.28784 type:complete len:253 (+) Transcript_10970:2430-3188(+)
MGRTPLLASLLTNIATKRTCPRWACLQDRRLQWSSARARAVLPVRTFLFHFFALAEVFQPREFCYPFHQRRLLLPILSVLLRSYHQAPSLLCIRGVCEHSAPHRPRLRLRYHAYQGRSEPSSYLSSSPLPIPHFHLHQRSCRHRQTLLLTGLSQLNQPHFSSHTSPCRTPQKRKKGNIRYRHLHQSCVFFFFSSSSSTRHSFPFPYYFPLPHLYPRQLMPPLRPHHPCPYPHPHYHTCLLHQFQQCQPSQLV